MVKFNVSGYSFLHEDGEVYEDTPENIYAECSVERLIQVLSKNKIFPRIKFDRQIELIYNDKKNLYVAAPTIKKAFHKLFITLFTPPTGA